MALLPTAQAVDAKEIERRNALALAGGGGVCTREVLAAPDAAPLLKADDCASSDEASRMRSKADLT